jgi:mRNA-degrading endonuclease HigB of HigAB toxin-antitoxin module
LIFDIGGNNYRLVAPVDFEEQMMWIDSIMTHEQYSRKDL